jgi:hypothetical protein
MPDHDRQAKTAAIDGIPISAEWCRYGIDMRMHGLLSVLDGGQQIAQDACDPLGSTGFYRVLAESIT